MQLFSNLILAALLLVSGTSVLLQSQSLVQPLPNQRYANFNQTQINYIRYIIQRAERQFSDYYNPFGTMNEFIYSDLRNAYPGFWNVLVYHKDDWRDKFYLTGMYDESTRNKRFYQVDTGLRLKYSVIILETNNTAGSELKIDLEMLGNQGRNILKNLQCQMISSNQVPVDLVYDVQALIRRTYAQNNNLAQLAVSIQKYMTEKYNEHWEVFTRLRDVKDLGFIYNSVDWHWVEYYYREDFPKDITVFIFRNYING